MRNANILQPAHEQTPFLSSDGSSYLNARIHIKMLDDQQRTLSYVRAIRETVRPGDVVVDIGTGTGVLAIAAAQAGAKRVYAIEATPIGMCAKELFKANGVDHIIELVEGMSTQVTLPEKADLFVSEIIGNKIFDENILSITADAKKRFLKPHARLIPGTLIVHAVPLKIPRDFWEQYQFTTAKCKEWQLSYGINFEPLASIQRQEPLKMQYKPQLTRAWTTSLEAIQLDMVDFKDTKPMQQTYSVKLTEHIEFNGLLIAFTAQLSDSESVSTLPQYVHDTNHWTAPVLFYNQPITGEAGDILEFTYSSNKISSITCHCIPCAHEFLVL